MSTYEIVAWIAGIAVLVSALILAITALVIARKKDSSKPQYKRTPQEQVDDYAFVNDVIHQ